MEKDPSPHSLMIHFRLKFREDWADKMIEKSIFCHPWGIRWGTRELCQTLSYEETDFPTKRIYRKKAGR
jgi:hypothetical protein